MAYFSLHAYDADVWIPSFVGLNEYGAGDSVDTRYATEALNVETPGGVLQPAARKEIVCSIEGSRAGNMMTFFRRWAKSENEKEILVIAFGRNCIIRSDLFKGLTRSTFRPVFTR